MPFTDTVKGEIYAGLFTKKACCRRAFLLGVLFMRGSRYGDTVRLDLEGDQLFETSERLVFEQFSRECSRLKRPRTVSSWMLTFKSSSALKYIDEFDNDESGIAFEERCDQCKRYFLCGVFCAAGRVSDPREDYRLEISCGARRASLSAFLEGYGLAPKFTDRRKEQLLYFRDSTAIEDFFAYMGATHAAFAMMDAKIERGMRNDANRLANCDANNINKSVAAAMHQIEYIERLIAENKMSFLPPELEATARLRLQYPDTSLVQLAAMADPPMTKSGLNHRLKKIVEMAEELLKDEKGGA